MIKLDSYLIIKITIPYDTRIVYKVAKIRVSIGMCLQWYEQNSWFLTVKFLAPEFKLSRTSLCVDKHLGGQRLQPLALTSLSFTLCWKIAVVRYQKRYTLWTCPKNVLCAIESIIKLILKHWKNRKECRFSTFFL